MNIDEAIDRALRGSATREELEAIATWRRESPEHERHYRRIERLMQVTGSLRPELRAAPPPTAAELFARGRANPEVSRPRYRGRRWWLGAAAAATLVIAAGVGRLTGGVGDTFAGAEIVTGPSELATVELGDGTVVRLAPSTRLRFGEESAMRAVTLDGHAYFAVAHDPQRPFLVRTNLGVARVLGTRFELATRGENLELTVVEGRVALDAPDNSVEVGRGERSRVAGRTASAPEPVAEAERNLDWVGTFLAFQSTALADAMREVERRYGLHITITDSVLARHTVTATFTSQQAADVVAVLCSVVSARCTTTGDTIQVSR